ncbi:hypothetical protein AB0K60_10830 [Thermopolyspora sp. NPDC052614]|uniref:hypothetical protein n=1 Tax=Thermopolyspora sp. NPDC052614 TaxID=3155682 RepID=UPI00344837F9
MLNNQITFRRVAAGTLLILAPLLQFIAVLVDPGTWGDDHETVSFGDNPALAQAQSALYHWSWILTAVAAFGLLHLARRYTVNGVAGQPAGKGLSVLANIGGTLTVVGYINLSALLLIDPVEWWFGQHYPPDQAGKLVDEVLNLPGVIFGFQMPWAFVGLVGLPLLAVAVWRARFIGWWVPALVAVGYIVPFVVPYGPVTVFFWAVPVIALGAVGVRVLRMGDAAWAAYYPAVPAPGRTTPDSYANTTA